MEMNLRSRSCWHPSSGPSSPACSATRSGAPGRHWVTILGRGACPACCRCNVLKRYAFDAEPVFNQAIYTWMVSDAPALRTSGSWSTS